MKKRKLKKGVKVFIVLIIIILIAMASLFILSKLDFTEKIIEQYYDAYLGSSEYEINLYDNNFEIIDTKVRGTSIKLSDQSVKTELTEEELATKNIDLTLFKKIKIDDEIYYVLEENVVSTKEESVKEKDFYVRTYCVLYNNENDITINRSLNKGSHLEVIGFDYLNDDGSVNMYKVKYDDTEGYVYPKYLVLTEEEALSTYNDENGITDIHNERGNKYGGGSASNLDYYPEEKPSFEDNVMPTEVRSLYINSSAIKNVDEYIALAKENNINAFVVDIKENTAPAYPSKALEKYSPTNYEKALNTYDEYKSYIQKLKDNGFYVIGRISTFKDHYYAIDHSENSILNTSTSTPFSHNSSYWPTAYKREVWEYNVAIAVEAVTDMGFNEIQFDYVRFPDRTTSLEESGVIDLQNDYNEDKAAAIQQFLMYARDELHKVHAYVSADVFGESANNYVTAYGQYWPAISNVVDVISAMPYPDHFNTYEFGSSVPVWTDPYTLLYSWGTICASKRQEETPSPAIVRTWIQAYNSIKEPYVIYDSSKISDEITGLYKAGLTGGYMTWNGSSSLDKYTEIASAFRKDYQ